MVGRPTKVKNKHNTLIILISVPLKWFGARFTDDMNVGYTALIQWKAILLNSFDIRESIILR